MKKTYVFGPILVLLTFCLIPVAQAQHAVPQDLTGTWELLVINEIADWGGEPDHEVFSIILTMTFVEGVLDPTEPNLLIDVPDSVDDFVGFARSDMFAVHKENVDNCGGPPLNFGREVITGTMNKKGTMWKGKGIGFDSNPECGGPWSYRIIAKKISD